MRKPRAYALDRSSGEIGDVFTKCGIGRQRSDPPRTLCLFFCATMTCLEHQSVLIKTCIFNHALLVAVLWFDCKEDYLQKPSESYVVIFGTKGWHNEMNSAPQEFKDLRKTGTQKLFWRIMLVPGFQPLPRRAGTKTIHHIRKLKKGPQQGIEYGTFNFFIWKSPIVGDLTNSLDGCI